MCSHNRQPESPPSEETTDELTLSPTTGKEGLGQALSQNNSDDGYGHNKTPKPNLPESSDTASMQQLLSKLAEQQRLIDQQREVLEHQQKELFRAKTDNYPGFSAYTSPSIQVAADPSPGPFNNVQNPVSVDNSDSYGFRPAAHFHEVNRLQSELKFAQSKISAMNDELVHTRIAKHTLDQVLSPSGEDGSSLGGDVSEQAITSLQTAFAQSTRPNTHRADSWPSASYDDSMADHSAEYNQQPLSTGSYSRPGIWATSPKSSMPQLASLQVSTPGEMQYQNALRQGSVDADAYVGSRIWNNTPRSFSLQGGGPPVTGDGRYAGRRSSYNPQATPFVRSNFEHGGSNKVPSSTGYTPSPIGTPLSPNSTVDFPSGSGVGGTLWGQPQGQTYISTVEPLNYRRLLERSVNCNWKYIVDKIVCNNDQQASIFLQQKLKIGTAEQKHAIVDSIVAQAYPLMINRFGNFLVQRCFEHGTPEQIDGIASAIRGNTLNLSMDAFGCHVIQKAFDCVSEDFKATMVAELLRRIPETVIHRYACHVWQKLFELRWSDSPPQIMKYVNEALRGMWHEVALGETGSLVVQNIFENCLEEDKRPCINEVLESIDLIAHGQFGNWCIQHICEHGAPLDRSRAVDTVVHNAAEYSMDQYASKVVEKCLKIGGNEFLDRYLDRVCEGRPDRPRIPLIDIASDQYGNYLVQWILQHASSTHREQVATHIRKHMVSLRGSKFGSRVGILCCNPMYNRSGTPSAAAPRYSRYGYR
ncbi:armadillo-type protein [Tuber brumale]|nr:armadillo-type protein [Tuber brumale]